jgi:general secretion pathway protein I
MRTRRGFTLLETIIALAILSMALMAIVDINTGAMSNHSYSKKLTVATLLARSKMTDLEQKLYDEGFSNDDDEESGDFSDEGWGNFKWRAKILAPRTQGVSPDQLIGAIFNLPMGGAGDDPMGGISSLFGAAGGGDAKGGPAAAGGGMGAMAGLAQPMFTQMIEQITSTVREVHLTVYWKEGTQLESLDVVTHVVSLGPGSDRNGGGSALTSSNGAQNSGGLANQWVNPATGAVVPNPIPGPNGIMLDPATRQPLMNGQDYLNLRNGGGQSASPSMGGGIFNGGRPGFPGFQQRSNE